MNSISRLIFFLAVITTVIGKYKQSCLPFEFIVFAFPCSLESQLICTFDRPILGDYYSYSENGLETHTSFKDNGDIDRRYYRRQSGLGATASVITLLDHSALGECIQMNYRSNPFEHASTYHYELILRDK